MTYFFSFSSISTPTCFVRQFVPIIVLALVCVCVFIITYSQVDDPEEKEEIVLELPNGRILGRRNITAQNTMFYVFEKIPYAEPPVGRLRFKAPRPAKNWTGILEEFRDVDCLNTRVQREGAEHLQSEDCLYINVYAPGVNSDVLRSVLVYVFGGKFSGGSAANHAPDMYVDEDVVFVTFNYRLGALGFFTTGDDVITGNFGHKDQALAFQWVKTNIHLFGGNPHRITVFGHSSGASSGAYHLLNPKSQGLFHAMVLVSGTFLSPPMFKRHGRQITFEIASLLNETFKHNNNSKDLYEYLVGLEATKIVEAADLYYRLNYRPWSNFFEDGTTIFGGTLEMPSEEAFLSERMYVLLNEGHFLRIPMLMGLSSEEKIDSLQDKDYLLNITRLLDKNLDLLVPSDMRIASKKKRRKMGEKIKQIYTEGQPFEKHLGKAVRYSSDNFMSKAVIKHADIHSKSSTVYFYQFSYSGRLSSSKRIFYKDAGRVGHTDLYSYMFCAGLSCTTKCNCSQDDRLVRRRFARLVTNFAKYHNPTPELDELLDNLTWPPVSTATGDFLYLNFNNTLSIENHPRNDSYRKWTELYGSLGYNDFDTF